MMVSSQTSLRTPPSAPVCYFKQTVYQAGRVEGVFRLEVPVVNLGYDQIHAGGAGIDPGDVASTVQGPEKQDYS